ncbi:MAG: 6-phosphogluconolactonase [Mycobacterium leprae]
MALVDAVNVFAGLEAMSRAAAEAVVAAAADAVAHTGRFTMGLSGGRTPGRLYELLGNEYRRAMPWDRTYLFWGDERNLPLDHAQSNYAMAKKTLLDRISIPTGHVHPVPVNPGNPDQAAIQYEETLRAFFGSEPPVFDLLLLGMGADGHTASLFPGHPAALEESHWVVAVHADVEPPVRISLTMPILTGARRTLFLVSGADKWPVWSDIQADPRAAALRYPAARVSLDGHAIWYLDQAVAAR